MKCVVTGGAGFIGSHVVEALRKAGHTATVLDIAGGVGVVARNVRDTELLIRMFRFHDFVFHLAAVADARQVLEDPLEAVYTNVAGITSVLEAARQTDIKRVVFASTYWISNATASVIPEEKFVARPGQHIYRTTKIAGEMLACDYYHLYGLPFTILRYGNPYGPRMWKGLVLRDFLDRAMSGQPLLVHDGGNATRNFVYVEDLAEAHVRVLNDVAENQVYNLVGARPVSIKELADLVVKFFPGIALEYVELPDRIGEFQRSYKRVSYEKAHVELGWEPRTSLEEGVQRTIDWCNAL